MSCPSWSEPSHSGSSFAAGASDRRRRLSRPAFQRRAALRVGQQPGRRRRQRRRRIEDGGRIGEADRRPDHPAVRLDLVGDERIAIVGPRLEAAELLLRVVDEDRKEELALVGDDQRPVVGDELGAERRRTARERSAATRAPRRLRRKLSSRRRFIGESLSQGRLVRALIRPTASATFSRKREKGRAASPPHPELVEGCGRGPG